MARVSILLTVAALILGMIGCSSAPATTRYNLTISSTEGGLVTTPGEGTGSFSYDEGEVVQVVAEPNEGYRFVNWTGDVSTIADVNAATTTITMSGNYSIMACFELKPTGAFLDEVVITTGQDPSVVVQQLKEDALDLSALGMTDAAIYDYVQADPDLRTVTSLGLCYEFTFNPVGPVFRDTGKLNPFSVKEFREAMNWLVDREYVVGAILGSLGIPRYTCISSAGADATVLYPDLIAEMNTQYAYNPTKAKTVVESVMLGLNGTKVGGKWMYGGQPVQIIGLIRTEDERKGIGDYFAGLLEGLGFTVIRTYGIQKDLSSLWQGDPDRGVFHFYTAGWVSSEICLDEGSNFGFFYTAMGCYFWPLFQAYAPDPPFYAAAEKLWNNSFASMEERKDLFKTCMQASMKDSVRVFLCDRTSFFPMRADARVASDAWGGVLGSRMWAQTAHFVDDRGVAVVGGTLRVALPDVFLQPWNPVAGTTWLYDMFPIRATADQDTQLDTWTGLRWPGRLEKADVTVEQGHPSEVKNTDWCNLTFAPEIVVPGDAWVDWSVITQTFITQAEKFGAAKTTAVRKTVSYFPKDIFKTPLHDGSTLSMGDFIMRAIIQFDRAKPESTLYDESWLAGYNAWIDAFKGVKFITDDPNYGLIVEYYSDFCPLNAELAVTSESTFWPEYSQGPGLWHTIALGVMAETDKELAFSGSKSDKLGVEWMSFIDGPSLPILKSYLDEAKATNYIPYGPTMGQYVTEAEAAERWSNLEQWYADKGHFWVGSGPFYLESADTAEKVVRLKRFDDYPDSMDKWLFLLEPLS